MGHVIGVLSALAKLGLDNPKFVATSQTIGVGSATAASPPVPNFPARSMEHVLKFSLTEAVTIGAPTGQTPVAFVSKLRILITDLAAAAIGFNAIYKAAPIQTGTGSNKKIFIDFIFDGVNWVQTNVTSATGAAPETKWL